ncbi:hypothetical protein LLH03_11400 [bacterium]|nr:hypothetical protein [bacterium]
MKRPRIAQLIALVGLAVGLIGLSGCKGAQSVAGDTAEATAKAFAEALNSEDYERAAKAFDYEVYARANFEDWDNIAPNQRRQIVGKLVQQKAQTLGALKKKLGAKIKAGPAQDGTVALTGDAGTLSLELKAKEGKYYIVNLW